MDFYNEKEISQIVKRSAELLKVEIEEEAINEISKRSRFTPRTANYFLKRCRDFAQVSQTSLSKEIASKALALLEVDELGLTAEDRKMLSIIIEKFDGGPVGLSTLGASLHEEEGTIEAVIEPYLLQIGLLERTPRGRSATKRAYEHLGYDYKDKKE